MGSRIISSLQKDLAWWDIGYRLILTIAEGMHFSLIRDEDLIRVDRDGKVVEGGKNKRLNYGTLTLVSWEDVLPECIEHFVV